MFNFTKNIKMRHLITIFLGLICTLLLSCSKSGSGTDDDDDGGADDNTAPATVSDLKVDFLTTTTATLSWTAPGDDGYIGWCYQMDFRGSYDSITTTNFEEAYRVNDIIGPFLGGSHQIWTLDSLNDDSTYFFAFKARDDMGNWSGLSNCVRAKCVQNQALIIPDNALEAAIRIHINHSGGDIMISDVDTIKELVAENAGISDLTGMQYFSSLLILHLRNNSVVDLTPLSGLVKLEGLHVPANLVTNLSPLTGLKNLDFLSAGDGPLADISPISSLTKLTGVNLGSCKVTDFTPLHSLTELEYIYIANDSAGNLSFITGLSKLEILVCNNTHLSDIAPLAGHPNLEELYLISNSISDISVLSELANLNYINLQYNLIANIEPLVDNAGLGTGDQVRLEGNPLSETSINTYIPALQSRGVTVTY
jgi:hypothetical protein